MNQSQHDLDMLYWLFGPGAAIRARVGARFHDVETDDEVMAWIFTGQGVPISYYASTGEAPGRSYLEIVGKLGTLVYENEQLRFSELSEATDDVIGKSEEALPVIAESTTDISIADIESGYVAVHKTFHAAIRGQGQLICPGEEGIHSVEWANAMLLSSVYGTAVDLPIDREAYDHLLADLRARRVTL